VKNSAVAAKKSAETWKQMALWAERKADKAAASDMPWARGNLRLYQNCLSLWWSEHYRALRDEELQELSK